MLYFAYGSNMNWGQMKRRCPSARFVSTAMLKSNRLDFTRKSRRRDCGTADIVAQSGCDVWGVVYEIDENDLPALDDAEEFLLGRAENGYTRQERYVLPGGDAGPPLRVALYVAEKQENPPLPNQEYKDLILEGARHWGLPREYVAALERIRVG